LGWHARRQLAFGEFSIFSSHLSLAVSGTDRPS
jgi:hypothetical protein